MMNVFDEEATITEREEAQMLALLVELVIDGRLTRPEAAALLNQAARATERRVD